jgi:hypothetical protein
MRYQAALRPEWFGYIELLNLFNEFLEMKSEIKSNLGLFQWGYIGSRNKKTILTKPKQISNITINIYNKNVSIAKNP